MAEYTGPSVRTMIATRTLASEIVARHSDSWPILDASEIELLRRFCTDSAAPHDAGARQALLADVGMDDADDGGPRSLVGYIIATHGSHKAAIEPSDVEMLRAWFEDGMP